MPIATTMLPFAPAAVTALSPRSLRCFRGSTALYHPALAAVARPRSAAAVVKTWILPLLWLALPADSATASTAAPRANIVQVVADDLGCEINTGKAAMFSNFWGWHV